MVRSCEAPRRGNNRAVSRSARPGRTAHEIDRLMIRQRIARIISTRAMQHMHISATIQQQAR